MTAPKRPREASSTDGASPEDASSKIESPTASASGSQQASSFRNVSACNRCRLRKNRCDQRLPACASCEKAHVKCVGYDPITKREIPRSYVYYLESRVAYLQSLLRDNQIPFAPPEHFALSYKPPNGEATFPLDKQARAAQQEGQLSTQHDSTADGGADTKQQEQYDRDKINNMVSNIGMVSVQGASDPRFLGSTSGISFARVVFAAVKSSVSGASSEKGSVRASKPLPTQAAANGTSMRDSFFGLHTKPAIRQAPFPERDLALKLVELYFEHANPQIPILHRGEFMSMFERALAADPKDRTSRELYMLNIVFAIGAGIIMGSSDATSESPDPDANSASHRPSQTPPPGKRRRLASVQHQPEEYHASAIIHLESFMSSSPSVDRPDGFGGGLEELQAVLLLAGFALLRPVAPGLWYITGVAVRLGVDLGLHYEDGAGIDGPCGDDTNLSEPGSASGNAPGANNAMKLDPKERGRRQWVRDLRRRLWWCVYSFDRLVSTCVGRPFGITDQVITTEFPSPLDDKYITREGFLQPAGGSEKPTYKCVSYHYFRLRLLQSEILQVLQHRQTQQARAIGANQGNDFMHTNLPSPFLSKFDSFLSWRRDIDRRLWEWKESSPTQMDTGVQFSPLFLELNYWQAVIMLYRQSLSVPSVLADELKSTEDDVSSPSMVNLEEREDEEHVFLKVAEAGQKVLKLYRQLHRVHLVNYTFLATHHLFMAGISFLYAIWHSPVVRSHLSLDDVDFTVLAATSVLGDLIEKCPPAEACRDAFDRMSKATIQMCMSTTGFGPQALGHPRPNKAQAYHSSPNFSAAEQQPTVSPTTEHPRGVNRSGYFPGPNTNPNYNSRRPHPRFDMNLRDLFSDDESESRLRRPSLGLVGMRSSNPMENQQVKREVPRPATSSATFISPNMRQFSTAHADSQLQTSAATSPVQIQQRPPHQRHHSHHQQMRQQPPQMSPYTQQQTSPYTPTYGSNAALQQQQQQTVSAYPDLSHPSFPDLDFLDAFPAGGASAEAGGGGNMDLGFGMQLDDVAGANNHDWSDGNAFDLFDGFFFGQGPGAPGSL